MLPRLDALLERPHTFGAESYSGFRAVDIEMPCLIFAPAMIRVLGLIHPDKDITYAAVLVMEDLIVDTFVRHCALPPSTMPNTTSHHTSY